MVDGGIVLLMNSNGRNKHGMSRTKLYRVWVAMIHRCGNPDYAQAAYYGGRGITVCERWRTFGNFYADMGERPPGTLLDRIDNDRGYAPDNCRWATPSQSQDNRRNTVRLTFKGETKPLSEWTALLQLNHNSTVYYRLRRGWSHERALSTPA